MANPYANIGAAPLPGVRNYARDGAYLAGVRKVVLHKSQKPPYDEMTIVEFVNLDTLRACGRPVDVCAKTGENPATVVSHKPGEIFGWVIKMSLGETALSAYKGFLSAVMEISAAEISAEVAMRAAGFKCITDAQGNELRHPETHDPLDYVPNAADPNPLFGARVKLLVTSILTKQGKPFTLHTFESASEADYGKAYEGL